MNDYYYIDAKLKIRDKDSGKVDKALDNLRDLLVKDGSFSTDTINEVCDGDDVLSVLKNIFTDGSFDDNITTNRYSDSIGRYWIKSQFEATPLWMMVMEDFAEAFASMIDDDSNLTITDDDGDHIFKFVSGEVMIYSDDNAEYKSHEGWAAFRASDHNAAISHENCDWSKPLCFDTVFNAVILPTRDAIIQHLRINGWNPDDKNIVIKYIKLEVKIY